MTTKLYDRDFYNWTLHQVDLLCNEDDVDLDRDNLIEEIEEMARRHGDALESHLVVLLRHLLKVSDLTIDEFEGHPLPVNCPWTQKQILDLNWLPYTQIRSKPGFWSAHAESITRRFTARPVMEQVWFSF